MIPKGTYTACTGNCAALMYKGKRAYFPHIHVPTRPDHTDRECGPGATLVINEGGGTLTDCDALATLFATSPELLKACEGLLTAVKSKSPTLLDAAIAAAEAACIKARWK